MNKFQIFAGRFRFLVTKILHRCLRRIDYPAWLIIQNIGLNSQDALRRNYHRKLIERYLDDYRRFRDSAWLLADGIYQENKSWKPDSEQLSAIIVMEYHRLEKGLSLPERRLGASQDVIPRLSSAICEHVERFGLNETVKIGISVLEAYRLENAAFDFPEEIQSNFQRVAAIALHSQPEIYKKVGGYKEISDKEIRFSSKNVGLKFFKGRHSIRTYTGESIDRKYVEQMLEIALTAPSVCNRQASRVYAIDSKKLICDVLKYQNGNRGFTDKVALLLVVVTDQRRFVSVEERNQGWIDGGLFSMNLMLGIHALGLGCCPLNWCASRENDRAVRALLEIPDFESVIMLISVGHIPERLSVATSTRRRVDEILRFIER
jgi:nitroreductase